MEFFDIKQRVHHKPPSFDAFFLDELVYDQGWLKVVEINARERFQNVQLARFSIKTDAVPIKYAISSVGVLLDFTYHQAGTDGVAASAGQIDGVPCPYRHA